MCACVPDGGWGGERGKTQREVSVLIKKKKKKERGDNFKATTQIKKCRVCFGSSTHTAAAPSARASVIASCPDSINY